MPVPPLSEPILLVGDSITVGYGPLVKTTAGVPRIILALGGQTAGGWGLPAVRKAEAQGVLDGPGRPRVAVVLFGTNDVGGSASAEAIARDLDGIWSILKHHGIRVVAMTVPPFGGYAGYAPRFAVLDQKRRDLNARIMGSTTPDQVIRLDQLLTDGLDPTRLARAYDGGDHVHPRPSVLAPMVQAEVQGASPPLPPPSSDEVSSFGSSLNKLAPFIVLGCIVVGGVVLARKRPLNLV